MHSLVRSDGFLDSAEKVKYMIFTFSSYGKYLLISPKKNPLLHERKTKFFLVLVEIIFVRSTFTPNKGSA